jgi:hypothetical protein
MNEFLCLTLLSQPGESQAAFQTRLYGYWTHILRSHPDEYEKVYSEAVKFETEGDQFARKYMIEESVVDLLLKEAKAHSVAYHEVDRDDWYSQAEASSSEWFQID